MVTRKRVIIFHLLLSFRAKLKLLYCYRCFSTRFLNVYSTNVKVNQNIRQFENCYFMRLGAVIILRLPFRPTVEIIEIFLRNSANREDW